ncbi:MAG: hypothetical protein V3T98_00440 [Candidatus Paceibacterota bacterium]
MSTTTITKKELKTAVKESVREVLISEIMKLRALIMPDVSLKEQKEIEKLYKKPLREAKKTIAVNI